MRFMEERASRRAADQGRLTEPSGAEARRPPRARLFGGDALRGGSPVGVGHAGSMRAQSAFSAIIVYVLLLACSLLPYGSLALAETLFLPEAAAHNTAASGKLDGYVRWDVEASPDCRLAYAAHGSSGMPVAGRSVRVPPFRSLPLLLTKTAPQQVEGQDALSIRAAAIAGASVAAVATLVSVWRHEPKGRHATKRRKTRPLQ